MVAYILNIIGLHSNVPHQIFFKWLCGHQKKTEKNILKIAVIPTINLIFRNLVAISKTIING